MINLEERIVKWHKKTFPHAGEKEIIEKLNEEIRELQESVLLYQTEGTGKAMLLDEIADVFIIGCSLAVMVFGMSLAGSIMAKFSIVKARNYDAHGNRRR